MKLNLREDVIFKITQREIRRILLEESASHIIDKSYTHEEVALAALCQQGFITHEEYLKQRITYEKGKSQSNIRLDKN